MFGRIPESIGDYQLIGRLGVGGTATVYLARARDKQGGLLHAAVKCLHPHLQEVDSVVEMFLHEAQLLMQLAHKNIVEVYDFGIEDGVPYIAMAHLHGVPLSDLLKRKQPIPAEILTYIAAEVCAGLHHAHNAKTQDGRRFDLVHRDVSPQNIFVTFSGKIKLIDFGIARVETREQRTEAGALKGKDGYMSPEQIECGALDRRSDVFTMGIVLWESLARSRLFDRKTQLATALAITEENAPDIRIKASSVSAALAAVINKSLRRAPDERHQTAKEMEQQLRRTLPSDFGAEAALRFLLVRTYEDDHSETQLEVKQDASPDLISVESIATDPNQAQPVAAQTNAMEGPTEEAQIPGSILSGPILPGPLPPGQTPSNRNATRPLPREKPSNDLIPVDDLLLDDVPRNSQDNGLIDRAPTASVHDAISDTKILPKFTPGSVSGDISKSRLPPKPNPTPEPPPAASKPSKANKGKRNLVIAIFVLAAIAATFGFAMYNLKVR